MTNKTKNKHSKIKFRGSDTPHNHKTSCLNNIKSYENNHKFINKRLLNLGMEKYWLIGFVEGEGCFHYFKNRGITYAVFSVCQKDKEIMEKIKSFFGCGHIYKMISGVWEYRITKQKELIKVVEFFNNEFQTAPKREQFNKWKEIVMFRNENFGKGGNK